MFRMRIAFVALLFAAAPIAGALAAPASGALGDPARVNAVRTVRPMAEPASHRDHGGYRQSHRRDDRYRHDRRGRSVHRGHHDRRACHPVVKIDYHRGHRAEIGGTMCYDRFGRGYVVPGSRYVIRYFGHRHHH